MTSLTETGPALPGPTAFIPSAEVFRPTDGYLVLRCVTLPRPALPGQASPRPAVFIPSAEVFRPTDGYLVLRCDTVTQHA